MKRGKVILYWALGILLIFILAALIWFWLPYSPMKAEYAQLKTIQNSELKQTNQVFTKQDIVNLPLPLQTYFEKCGYIGKPKMFNIKITHKDVDFILSPKMPKLKIQCIQYNSAAKPERIALIDTRLYGIPFEGIDAYQKGSGSMKGMIAKSIVLFNQKGEAMNKSSLVNCLAESLLVPSIALQNFISWEDLGENKIKGTITYYGLSVSGVFTFDNNGFLERFTTSDRVNVDTNGQEKQVEWSAVCGDYRDVNGIMQPKSLKAIWHYPEGDLVYFEGYDTVIEYNVNE